MHCLVLPGNQANKKSQFVLNCQHLSRVMLASYTAVEGGYHHNHHQITELSHGINAIGPAPHRRGLSVTSHAVAQLQIMLPMPLCRALPQRQRLAAALSVSEHHLVGYRPPADPVAPRHLRLHHPQCESSSLKQQWHSRQLSRRSLRRACRNCCATAATV
jgi:hypothetical protein